MKRMKSSKGYRRVSRLRARRGAATVEFAFVSAIFFGIVFTCIQFNRVNLIRNLMQDAAYFAARKAMVPGAVMQDAITEANAILALAGTQGAIVTVNGGSELNRDSSQISVTVRVPLDQNAVVFPYVMNNMLTTTATMRTERYDKFFDGSL